MSNFKLMITPTGKHPASKWGELAANEIIEISDDAPETRVQEAREFREKLIGMLTKHHQVMMDHEQKQIKEGKHDLNQPYETEEYSSKVVDEICDLAAGYSFAKYFESQDIHKNLETICNRNFKSAKLVERSHFHSEKPQKLIPRIKKIQ